MAASVRTAALLFLAALALAFAGTAAYATPSPSEVEKQINALWTQSEQTIEQYNAVHARLMDNQAKLTRLHKQLDPLQLQVQMAYSQVGVLSAQLYMRGPAATVNALLASGTPATLADQLSTLDQMAKHQQASIADVQQKVADYDRQRQPLDVLVNQLAQQDADLAAKKKTITDQLAQLQKLRVQAYGSSGGTGGSLKPVVCPQIYIGGAAGRAVAYACAHIGAPYSWGAAGPSSFDCSGLAMAAWAAGGKSLYHQSAVQKSDATYVSPGNARPGDLVFYGSPPHHVGIYIGNGWMVHAPHDGDHVREARVDSLGETPSYGRP
ncbi:MAG TPA: NlpC/P60 family protein [Rugosimonospora sp.]|nr:NlpC/P60 family protein [Rugosimonospora sp.]